MRRRSRWSAPRSRSHRRSTASSRSTLVRACAGASPAKSGAAPAGADHGIEMLLEPIVAFARAALEARPIGHAHVTPAGRDQPFGTKLLDDRIDRGSLHAEQPRERFLGQLDAVAGTVLRMEQPARGALGNGVKAVA